MKSALPASTALLASLVFVAGTFAQDPKPSGKPLELGKYKITTPAGWQQQQPKSTIVMYEFSSPAVEDDKANGRMTVMAAGGSVEQNVDRWYGQFKQPDGSDSKDKAKLEKRMIAGRDVHFFDLSGTYREPFGATGDQPNYRMLAAIIVTPEANFYVKYYGPRKTITANEKPFKEMIESLGIK
jgi:hypothetical protein